VLLAAAGLGRYRPWPGSGGRPVRLQGGRR